MFIFWLTACFSNCDLKFPKNDYWTDYFIVIIVLKVFKLSHIHTCIHNINQQLLPDIELLIITETVFKRIVYLMPIKNDFIFNYTRNQYSF